MADSGTVRPGSRAAQTAEVAPPEPGLSPEDIIARAQALIPAVREQQDEAERLGQHTAAAGSSAARRGQRLQRYYRDVSMYHGHIAAQYLNTAGELARVHFGLPDTLF